MSDLCELVITAPDPEWLLAFTRQLVDKRLCAAAHNFAPIQSVYRWQGEVHERREGRASLHTRTGLVAEITRLAKEQHPYEVLSISTRLIDDGSPEYLEWIRNQTAAPSATEQP